MSGWTTPTRREMVRAAGGVFTGKTYLATFEADSLYAQEAKAAITFNDQRSDGNSVVIAEARTSVKARLLVVTGSSTVFRELQLTGGTDYMDRTVELTKPIQETQRIRVELRTADGNDELLARDRALIAVDESLSEARSTVNLSNGQAELIEPDRAAGFSYPYLLFTLGNTPDSPRPLFVETHNAPEVSTRGELRTQVTGDAKRYLKIPNELRIPGLIPAFPRTPNDGPDMIQGLGLPSYRSDELRSYTLERISTDEFPKASLKRVDKQLIAMIDDARARLKSDGYTLTDQIHMNGFSSSGSFASRFALLYPELVGVISPGGDGAHPLPKESMEGTKLPYPLGIADYQRLRGKEFELSAWKDIDQYIYVGQEDQPLPSTDPRSYWPISIRYEQKAEKVFGKNRVTERFPVTKSVYQSVGANATFRIYEDVGHRFTKEMRQDVIDFYRSASGIKRVKEPFGIVDWIGIGAVLGGLGGLGYLLKRRNTGEEGGDSGLRTR